MDKATFWTEPKHERAEIEKAQLFKQGEGPAPNPAIGFWTVIGREDVTTLAGEFKDSFQLKQFFNNGAITVWFKPGVGPIKIHTSHIGSFQESETLLINWKKVKG